MADNVDEVGLEEVRAMLTARGYEVVGLEKVWRHVTGKVVKNDKMFFFKMAATPEISEFTRNEHTWDEILTKRPLGTVIQVPHDYDAGVWRERFWFMADYIGGRKLADPEHPGELAELRQWLPEIAKLIKAIMTHEFDGGLLRDVRATESERKEKFWENINEWEKVAGRDLSELKNFIRERMRFVSYAPSHGDLVPWHLLFGENGQLYLVDGEHGKTQGIKFYDLAYCYHRLFTSLRTPELANELLTAFLAEYLISADERELFRAILAQRVIGGYFDAARDSRRVSRERQDELTSRLLTGRVI